MTLAEIILCCFCGSAMLAQSQKPATAWPIPVIFAPGIISGPANDGSPTFAPDGRTLFYTRSGATWSVILESHKITEDPDGWSAPMLAPFSGEWPDSSPSLSPDGSFIIFNSIRPLDGDATHRAAQLYRSDRNTSGWSQPVRLSDSVNIGHSIWKPSVAADGSLYFLSIDPKGGKRLFSSAYVKGAYQTAQPLPFSDGTLGDVDPEIAPDQSFLVFSSSGRVPNDSKDHLFICLRKNAVWGDVIPIRYTGDDKPARSADDDPTLAPDKRTLFFSSDRSLPVRFPRTREEAQADLERLNLWDNSNANVWSIPLDLWIGPRSGE
jgi:hypothetical protein